MKIKPSIRFTNFYELVKLRTKTFDPVAIHDEFNLTNGNTHNVATMINIPLRYHYHSMFSESDKQLLRIFYGNNFLNIAELDLPKEKHTTAETNLTKMWDATKDTDPFKFYDIETLLIKKLKECSVV